MRIVHVSDVYLPRLGGIETQVHDLAAHQIASGHQAWVLTREVDDAPVAPDGLPEVPVRRVRADLVNRPPRELRRDLAGVLDSVDAVHVHSSVLSPFGWTVAAAAGAAGVPTAVTLHSLLPYPRRLLAASARVIGWRSWPVAWSAVSDAAARPLRDVLGDGVVRVLPNGITVDDWRPDRPRGPRRASDGLTIVSVLRLVPRKRPLALLRILHRVRDLVPASVPIRAVLIGEGPQRPRVERYLERTGMTDWVELTGRLDRAEIRGQLGRADVYLAPADLESFGIAALEARCAGLPVVAKTAGGVGTFVRHGREGLLVDTDDDMARATAQLLTSPRLAMIREHNRRTRPAQTWPSVIGQSLDLYAAAAAQNERAARLPSLETGRRAVPVAATDRS